MDAAMKLRHELRQPLTPILFVIRLLRQFADRGGAPPSELVRAAATLEKSAGEINRLAADWK
jgi:nitrogen fixation/metabolism regulation signal transduction histidine kinase